MMMIIAGWLAASYALVSFMVGFDFHSNLFNWSPKLDFKTVVDGLMVLVVIGGILVSGAGDA